MSEILTLTDERTGYEAEGSNITKAVDAIDESLRKLGERELVSTDEAKDMLLDVRQLLIAVQERSRQ